MAEAVDAARLEEAAQIEEWGLVEGGHDIDISDIKVSILLRLSIPARQHVPHHPLVEGGHFIILPAPCRYSAVDLSAASA